MSLLHFQAEKALTQGEVPVGCVLVDVVGHRIVSSGHNQTNATANVRYPLSIFLRCVTQPLFTSSEGIGTSRTCEYEAFSPLT